MATVCIQHLSAVDPSTVQCIIVRKRGHADMRLSGEQVKPFLVIHGHAMVQLLSVGWYSVEPTMSYDEFQVWVRA